MRQYCLALMGLDNYRLQTPASGEALGATLQQDISKWLLGLGLKDFRFSGQTVIIGDDGLAYHIKDTNKSKKELFNKIMEVYREYI